MDLNKVPELRKELEFITAHPEHWRQDFWWADRSEFDNYDLDEDNPFQNASSQCGTVGCLAGNAVAHSTTYFIQHESNGAFAPIHKATGHTWDWHTAGAEVLGLTHNEAQMLFSERNTLYRMWSLANEFSEYEIAIPDYIPVDDGCRSYDDDE